MKPPKEYAIELVEKYKNEIYDVDAVDGGGWENCRLLDKSVIIVAKKCAIIAVNEIIEHNQEHLNFEDYHARLNELNEVINEIQNIN